MVKKLKDASAEERILTAAKKVFLAKGMSGARMQDIADEAGINKALVHYYFKNKEQLFEKIFMELSTSFFPKMVAIFASPDSLKKKIESFCSAYIDNILDNPHIPLFVLNEISQRPATFIKKVLKVSPLNMAFMSQQIDAQIKAVNIKPISAVQLMMNVLSMCIFPFIGKPILMNIMKLDEGVFRQLMEARKREIPKFIFDSIKK